MSSRQECDDYWDDSQIKLTAKSDFIVDFESVKNNLEKVKDNLNVNTDNGFVFVEENDDSVSKTLEYEQTPKSARYQSNFTQQNQKISSTEVAKLQAQVNYLERSTKELLPVTNTVLNLISDKFYPLENYRSLDDKVAIINQAIKLGDGNVIIRAVIHLKKTTKPSIFYQKLLERPVAINHYVNYLRVHNNLSELEDFFVFRGMTYDAALLAYKIALSKSTPESIIKSLQMCLRNTFSKDPDLTVEASLISEHLFLLERQLPIEAADKKAEIDGTVEMFKQIPRSISLPHQSLMDTLHYCCLYHYGEKDTNFASPESLRKSFSLSNKQYMYMLILAFAEQGFWKHIEQVVFTKNYLGGHKIKSDLNIEKVLLILHRKGAPQEVLNKYIPYIENLETRLEVAKTYKSYNIAIETLVRLKDRQRLISLKKKFHVHSIEHSLADDALRRSDVKWKS